MISKGQLKFYASLKNRKAREESGLFIVEGHKVASGLAIIGAVVAEFVAGSGGAEGLAWRILEAGNRLRTAEMFAAIVTLALMAAVVHLLFQALEKRALIWWRGR